ncbi:MAG TPA: AMP-binding protein, partial [Clostridiales bacterium]|nr:AMP-binding protein [Clostridiales bacterium]
VLVISNLVGSTPKPGSMGKPVPLYDVAIVDEDGNTVPDGETGEIVIRTEGKKNYGVFKEYYNDPETTSKAWHDGLYHTGDTAWRDEDGYFWYVGRTDDVIKASGYRIGPFEIESVLLEHAAVLEVAVTGAKDPIRGQVVKATIVLTKEYKDKASDSLVKELQDHVKHQTAPYKYPRIIEFVDELPKTISGKIRRVEIRERDNTKD